MGQTLYTQAVSQSYGLDSIIFKIILPNTKIYKEKKKYIPTAKSMSHFKNGPLILQKINKEN